MVDTIANNPLVWVSTKKSAYNYCVHQTSKWLIGAQAEYSAQATNVTSGAKRFEGFQ